MYIREQRSVRICAFDVVKHCSSLCILACLRTGATGVEPVYGAQHPSSPLTNSSPSEESCKIELCATWRVPLMALRQSCLDALADSVLTHPKLDAITRAAA